MQQVFNQIFNQIYYYRLSNCQRSNYFNYWLSEMQFLENWVYLCLPHCLPVSLCLCLSFRLPVCLRVLLPGA